MCRCLPEPPPEVDYDQGPLEEGKLDHALIPHGDWKRLKAVLPQTEVEYHEASAEHMNGRFAGDEKLAPWKTMLPGIASRVNYTETVPSVIGKIDVRKATQWACTSIRPKKRLIF